MKMGHDMIFNRKVLFDGLRAALKPAGFTGPQDTSIAAIVDEFEKRKLPDVRWLAYILATVWHEARFISQPEIGRGKGKKYGKPHKLTGKIYYGRSFSQITWYENYLKFEKTLNLPLTENPDLALVVPVAVQILFEGMMTGVTAKDSFTKYQLHDFFNDTKDDPVMARSIINGRKKGEKLPDKSELIAGYHKKILVVLKDAVRSEIEKPAAMKPAPPVVKPDVESGSVVAGTGAAVVITAAASGVNWWGVAGLAVVAVVVVAGIWMVLKKGKTP